jgi:hypothetical protein
MSDSPLTYADILISQRGITELDKGKVSIFVPRDDVQGIRLIYGSPANRPVLEASVGALLTACGLMGIYFLAMNPGNFRYDILIIAIGVIGVAMLRDVLGKTHVLEITTKSDVLKLAFAKTAELESARAFCVKACESFNYTFEGGK